MAKKENKFEAGMVENTPGGCYLQLRRPKTARFAMKTAMNDLFGQSDRDRMGWPESFWEGMKDYAESLVKGIVRGKAASSWWSFLK
jgi:hypothetical protein